MLPRLLGAGMALLISGHVHAQTHTSGDMVGSLKPDGAVVWTRASTDAKVTVLYATNPQLAGALQAPPAVAVAATDYTAKVVLTGLTPDTDYWYTTRLEGTGNVVFGALGRFKTPPLPTTDAPVKIALSGDVFDRFQFGIFDQMRAQAPDLYLSLGDYAYCDPAVELAEFRSKHQAMRIWPALQNFFRATGAECVWDDHEIADDWDATTDPKKVANGKAAWFEYFP